MCLEAQAGAGHGELGEAGAPLSVPGASLPRSGVGPAGTGSAGWPAAGRGPGPGRGAQAALSPLLGARTGEPAVIQLPLRAATGKKIAVS